MRTYKDHDLMREGIFLAVIEEMQEKGLESLTLRGVARRMGCSTTVILHYFINKGDLLTSVHSFTSKRAIARLQAAIAQEPAGIEGLIEALLPLDDDRRREWAIWIAFWGAAIGNAAYAETQRVSSRETHAIFEKQLEAVRTAGRIAATVDCAAAARTLLLQIYAIGLEATFDPEAWPADVQLSYLMNEFARFAPSEVRAGGEPDNAGSL